MYHAGSAMAPTRLAAWVLTGTTGRARRGAVEPPGENAAETGLERASAMAEQASFGHRSGFQVLPYHRHGGAAQRRCNAANRTMAALQRLPPPDSGRRSYAICIFAVMAISHVLP